MQKKVTFAVVGLCILLILTFSVRSETETTENKAEEKLDAPNQSPVIERSSHHHHEVTDPHHGFWKKKFAWRPRWVKTWQEKKVYVAVWKRMWGPIEVNEWVPLPKPPPGWIKHDVGSYVVKGHPH